MSRWWLTSRRAELLHSGLREWHNCVSLFTKSKESAISFQVCSNTMHLSISLHFISTVIISGTGTLSSYCKVSQAVFTSHLFCGDWLIMFLDHSKWFCHLWENHLISSWSTSSRTVISDCWRSMFTAEFTFLSLTVSFRELYEKFVFILFPDISFLKSTISSFFIHCLFPTSIQVLFSLD